MDTTLTQKTIELYLLLLKSDKVNAKSFSAEYQDWSIWHVFLVHNIRVHFLICGILSPELAPFLSSRILMLWAIKIKVGFFWNFLVENLNKFLDLSPNPVLPKAVSSILFFQIGLFQEQSDVLFLLKPLRQNLKDHLQQSWRFRYRETCVLKNLTRFYFTLNACVEEEVIILFVKLPSTTEWGNIKVMWSCWT